MISLHEPIFTLTKPERDQVDEFASRWVVSSDNLMRLSNLIANAIQLVVEREMIRQGRLEPIYRGSKGT